MSTPAERMRRYRERHRQGATALRFDLPWEALIALCDAGLIPDSCEDPERIAEAIVAYLMLGGE